MRRFPLILGTLLLFLCIARMSHSQDIRVLNANRRGSGTLRLDRQRPVTFDRAQVSLRRNGEAELRFYGNRLTYAFFGRWTQSRRNLELTLNSGSPLNRVGGSGQVIPGTRGGFDRVELRGNSDRGAFRLDFDTDRAPDRPNPPDRPDPGASGNILRDLSMNAHGEGTLTLNGKTTGLNRLILIMRRNHDFDLRVFSEAQRSFHGRWSGGRNGTFTLDFRDDSGDPVSNGSGKVILPRPGTMDRLEAQGDSKDGRFTLTFKAFR